MTHSSLQASPHEPLSGDGMRLLRRPSRMVISLGIQKRVANERIKRSKRPFLWKGYFLPDSARCCVFTATYLMDDLADCYEGARQVIAGSSMDRGDGVNGHSQL